MFYILILLAVSSFAKGDINEVGVKWINLPNMPNLYYFAKYGLNWLDALAACGKLDSYLVTLETEEEFDIIIHHLEGLVDGRNHSYWTSGSDQYQEGRWVWMSNGQPVTFKRWCDWEPSNAGNGEGSMQIVGQYGYCWNDAGGTWPGYNGIQFRFICEKTLCPWSKK